jgi:hypothetical protein
MSIDLVSCTNPKHFSTCDPLHFEHARSGHLQPVREPSHLLTRPAGSSEPCRRRPADVLIPVWPEARASTLPAGNRASLDFAVINAMGPGHVALTARSSGTAAASEYAQKKMTFEDTAARCAQHGILLKPVVYTAQGAIDPSAGKTLEVIHRCVAAETGVPLPRVREDFAVRLAVLLVRSNARAARRRDPDGEVACNRGADKSHLRARTALSTSAALAEASEQGVHDLEIAELAAETEGLSVGGGGADADMPDVVAT